MHAHLCHTQGSLYTAPDAVFCSRYHTNGESYPASALRPLAAAAAKVLSALTARGGVTAEIALSEGSAAMLALKLLQQSLQWLPSVPGREASLYTAQALTALAASGGSLLSRQLQVGLYCPGSFRRAFGVQAGDPVHTGPAG